MGSFHGVTVPRQRQLAFLSFLKTACERSGVGFALKGSLASGSAREYSDIDLLIFLPPDRDHVEELLGFETPLMVNLTQRPPGIVMVTYGDGLCVELDCREWVTPKERNAAVVVDDTNLCVRNGPVGRRSVTIAPIHHKPYASDLRLLYKALIKKLCERHEAAEGLLGEFQSTLGTPCDDTSFVSCATDLYAIFRSRHSVDPGIDTEIRNLLLKCRSAPLVE